MANKKLREQGLLQLKTKEFTNVNDCFQLMRNAIIGVLLLPLIMHFVVMVLKYLALKDIYTFDY